MLLKENKAFGSIISNAANSLSTPRHSLLSRNDRVFLTVLEQRRFLPYFKCVVFLSLYSSPSCLIAPFCLQGDLILRFNTLGEQDKMEEVYWSNYSRLVCERTRPVFLFIGATWGLCRACCSCCLLALLSRSLSRLSVDNNGACWHSGYDVLAADRRRVVVRREHDSFRRVD